MPKNILLTGSGGFIGKNLKENLKDKYNLLTPRSFELDCIDKTAVEKYFTNNKIDLIIHCATVGGIRGLTDKDTTLDDNLKMVDNILSAKNANTRVILFGSGAMYDKSREIIKIKEIELGNIVPTDLYGKSKMLIAQKIKDRTDILCLNIFACYGYNEKATRFPSYAITQNLKKEPIIINQDVIFDYLFIEDFNKIIEYFIENIPQKNIINITPTNSISLLEIAKIINEISDYKSEIIIKNELKGNEYSGDNSLLLNEMQNLQFTPYKIGLNELYKYIKQNISLI